METNEIMNNEVIEAAEEIVPTGAKGKAFAAVAGVGLAVLVGGVAYKYAVKPLVAKYKSKKAQEETSAVLEVVSKEIDGSEES